MALIKEHLLPLGTRNEPRSFADYHAISLLNVHFKRQNASDARSYKACTQYKHM